MSRRSQNSDLRVADATAANPCAASLPRAHAGTGLLGSSREIIDTDVKSDNEGVESGGHSRPPGRRCLNTANFGALTRSQLFRINHLGVDARGERDELRDRGAGASLAGKLVDPALPVHLGQLAREGVAELGTCPSTACRGRGAGRCGRARRRRAIRRRASPVSGLGRRVRPGGRRPSMPRRARRGPRLGPSASCSTRLARCRIAAPPAPGWLAAASYARVGIGRAAARVRDVDPRGSNGSPVRHRL